MSYPFPGWNEGFTTSAPLVYLALKGQNVLPVVRVADPGHGAGRPHRRRHDRWWRPRPASSSRSWCTSCRAGTSTPRASGRVVTLTGLYKRKRFQSKETGNRFINALAARMEFRPVSYRAIRPLLDPAGQAAGRADLGRRWSSCGPRWGGGRFAEIVDRVKGKVDDVAPGHRRGPQQHRPVPALHPRQRQRVPRRQHPRPARPPARRGAGRGALVAREHRLVRLLAERPLPRPAEVGVARAGRDLRRQAQEVYAYRDLLELFDTTTKLHATRPAMRIERGQARGDLQLRRTCRSWPPGWASSWSGEDVGAGDRVMLCAKNGARVGHGLLRHPEGGRHRGADRPRVDGRRGGQRRPRLRRRRHHDRRRPAGEAGRPGAGPARGGPGHPGVARSSRCSRCSTRSWSRSARKSLHARVQPDTVASLIFTSGTTGKPKGVMLTHRNFTFMVSELSRVFEFGVNDGMLSVLPLHHTFEFSTGPADAAGPGRPDHLPGRADRRGDLQRPARRATSPPSSACPRCGSCCAGG